MPDWNAEIGPWHCVTMRDGDEHADFLELFLEVHGSHRGDGIVFRVSKVAPHWKGEEGAYAINLGECAILTREGAIGVRDRLTELIENLETKDDA